jgi:hypothetical protein
MIAVYALTGSLQLSPERGDQKQPLMAALFTKAALSGG